MCKVLDVSRSGYYKWKRTLTVQGSEETTINEGIWNEFEESGGTYGAPRITLSLAKKGVTVSESTVSRRMKVMGLMARKKRKFKITTQSNHGYKIAPNLLQREFDVEQ